MTNREIYKIWAPVGARWVDWVRPVPFVFMQYYNTRSPLICFTVPAINYIEDASAKIGIIIDLPSYESVREGIALARLGFRPIPVFNGTNQQDGAMALVNNSDLEDALKWGAGELEKTHIATHALPAFLMDSNRTHRFKASVSYFDNSWDIYSQDLPTAQYFLDHGINKIVIRAERIQTDLARILYKFQIKGISIFFTDGYEPPKEIILKKPSTKVK